jgi:hypothetical protein
MKKSQFLLLDAGPIIKLFSTGSWNNFIKYCDVSISRIIADNEALHTEEGEKRIDLKPYEEQGHIKILDVETATVKAFYEKFDRLYKVDIHPGERETLAFLFSSSENWSVCSADGAVFRVLGLLGKANQGISLEEILQKIGLPVSGQLEWKYTKKFREKWTPFKTEACGSLSGFGNTSCLDAIVLEIWRKEFKRAELLPDIANNYGRKSGQKNLAWVKKKRIQG